MDRAAAYPTVHFWGIRILSICRGELDTRMKDDEGRFGVVVLHRIEEPAVSQMLSIWNMAPRRHIPR